MTEQKSASSLAERVPQVEELKIKDARGYGKAIALSENATQRSLRRPRTFFPREPEPQPLIVANVL